MQEEKAKQSSISSALSSWYGVSTPVFSFYSPLFLQTAIARKNPDQFCPKATLTSLLVRHSAYFRYLFRLFLRASFSTDIFHRNSQSLRRSYGSVTRYTLKVSQSVNTLTKRLCSFTSVSTSWHTSGRSGSYFSYFLSDIDLIPYYYRPSYRTRTNVDSVLCAYYVSRTKSKDGLAFIYYLDRIISTYTVNDHEGVCPVQRLSPTLTRYILSFSLKLLQKYA